MRLLSSLGAGKVGSKLASFESRKALDFVEASRDVEEDLLPARSLEKSRFLLQAPPL